MRVTKQHLAKIIKEEYNKLLKEQAPNKQAPNKQTPKEKLRQSGGGGAQKANVHIRDMSMYMHKFANQEIGVEEFLKNINDELGQTGQSWELSGFALPGDYKEGTNMAAWSDPKVDWTGLPKDEIKAYRHASDRYRALRILKAIKDLGPENLHDYLRDRRGQKFAHQAAAVSPPPAGQTIEPHGGVGAHHVLSWYFGAPLYKMPPKIKAIKDLEGIYDEAGAALERSDISKFSLLPIGKPFYTPTGALRTGPLALKKEELKKIIKEEYNKLLLEDAGIRLKYIAPREQEEARWTVWKDNVEVGKIAQILWGATDGTVFVAYDIDGNTLGEATTQGGAVKFFEDVPHTTSQTKTADPAATTNEDPLTRALKNAMPAADIDIIKHNYRALERYMEYQMGDWGSASRNIILVLAGVPLLQQNKLVKRLGVPGAFGTAFLLDNDHVLKLFTGGLEGVEEELKNYKDLRSGQEMGTAGLNQPAVFDFGHIPNTRFYFAEISRVIPLDSWFEQTGRGNRVPELWALVSFKDHLSDMTRSMYTEKDDPSNPRFRRKLAKLFALYAPKFKEAGMTREEIMQYFKAVLKLINKYGLGRVYDVHYKNVGMMPRRNGPDEFVIFDF